VDVEFPDNLPSIYNALTVEFEVPGAGKTKQTLEVEQHLGDNWVRTVCMGSTEGLKRVGIQTIRCINVDPAGTFDAQGRFTVENAGRLDWHLDGCRALGAVPHVVLGGWPEQLRVRPEDIPAGPNQALYQHLSIPATV